MSNQPRPSSARRRRGLGALPSGPVAVKLMIVCIATIGVSLWGVLTMGPYLFGEHRPVPSAATERVQRDEPLMVGLQTQTRGLLDLDIGDGTKYLMVQCHRGQFSNRLSCLQRGVLLARALQRVLVLPIFTDAAPAVDVSKYVSLECFRRNSQAVTFAEFRERLCRGVGLDVPPVDAYSFVAPNATLDAAESSGSGDSSSYSGNKFSASASYGNDSRSDGAAHKKRGGSFCEDGAMLQLESGYSLADYRGYTCWARREDITNARDLGVAIKRCTHVPPAASSPSSAAKAGSTRYDLDAILAHFAGKQEKVLLFLDLFGVDLMSTVDDLARTVSEPGQMCGWMPTERAAAAADVVMQSLVPARPLLGQSGGGGSGGALVSLGAALASSLSSASAFAGLLLSSSGAGSSGDSGAGALNRRNVLLSAASGSLASSASSSLAAAPQPVADVIASSYPPEGDPPPLRLRGERSYVAVHFRRSDWFYYCAGARNCFYSMTEAGAWLNATLAERGLDTLYVSTNADAREKEMLRRAVSGNVLYWEDVLVQLKRWQAEAAAAAAAAPPSAPSAAGAAAVPPGWLASLPLGDELMVQMVEKAICMQASDFVSSKSSTFSNQIRSFRNSGLEYSELEALVRKFGPNALPPATTEATTATAAALAPPPLPPPRADASSGTPYEPAAFLCGDAAPVYPDSRRFPDFQNPNLFLEQARRFLGKMKRSLLGACFPQPPTEGAASTQQPHPPLTLGRALLAPWRFLQRFVLAMEDGHAMSAANRFVEMYTGGAVAALVLQGRQEVPPARLAECVAAAAVAAGARALHVALPEVPPEQQVLLMQALEERRELAQVTRLGGPDQERGSTFTLLWRGDGLGRRAEPALLEELPTFLERTEHYLLAKARVLLGDPRGLLFRQAENTRRLFGFDDPRDGACSPEQLLAPVA